VHCVATLVSKKMCKEAMTTINTKGSIG